MTTEALHPHEHAEPFALPRWLIVGFLAGALSVLILRQASPFGLQLWPLAAWGAIWGALLAASLARLRGSSLVFWATAFGTVLPTLAAWFVLAPLTGEPIALGFAPVAMLVGLIVDAAWGLGTGIGLAIFGQRRPPPD